ncbi:MBL fold metallo-hydrolase [Candidatus Acetothermia bacterium]|nr:MBL fold metallo-hydrolase [Candidatus Acetothermia bacterium]MBI3643477.1 MBL fold metallo-hydrolase [Candidatus Acetothermia bacterium]
MAIRMTLLGTGGALPPSGRAQTGFLLEKSRKALLVDCGSGILLRLSQAGIDLKKIDTILISHHHLDHMSEVLPLITARWLAGHSKTRVIGPAGTKRLLSQLLELYPYVQQRVEVEIEDMEPNTHIEAGGFQVDSLAVSHWIPTLAFKFDNEIAYSADTEPWPPFAEFAEGCKMIIHECSVPNHEEMPFHTNSVELGKLLAGSPAKKLVLMHFYPHMIGKEESVVTSIKKHFSGQIILGEDLAQYEL